MVEGSFLSFVVGRRDCRPRAGGKRHCQDSDRSEKMSNAQEIPRCFDDDTDAIDVRMVMDGEWRRLKAKTRGWSRLSRGSPYARARAWRADHVMDKFRCLQSIDIVIAMRTSRECVALNIHGCRIPPIARFPIVHSALPLTSAQREVIARIWH